MLNQILPMHIQLNLEWYHLELRIMKWLLLKQVGQLSDQFERVVYPLHLV